MEALLINTTEAAKLLGMSKSTLYKFIASGRFGLMPIRFGRKRLYSAEKLRAYVDAGCPRAHKQPPKIKTKKPLGPGYVYLIKVGTRHKIGISQYPKERLKKYRTENPQPVIVLCCIKCRNSKELEQYIVTTYRKNIVKGKEWLGITNNEADVIIALLREKSLPYPS